MTISIQYMEIKRRAKNGCLQSMLDLADCYSQGLYGVNQNQQLYLQTLLEITKKFDELRASEYSSALILYEVMYHYLEQQNMVMAEHYHHYLTWELVWDYPSEDMEPYFEQYQIREIAECLGKDMEDIIEQVKIFQQKFNPDTYKVLGVNDFFTN